MNQLIYLKGVVSLRLESNKCMGCGMCLSVCPHGVFGLTNGKVEILNRDACMECGACANNCPTEALHVRPGVGCAVAIIHSMLGRKKSSSCCTIDSYRDLKNPINCSQKGDVIGCC